jgi:alkaline phosphatase
MRIHGGRLSETLRDRRSARSEGAGVAARFAVLLFALLACAAPAPASHGAQGDASCQVQDRARNVVLFIGDGMGISTVTAARILEGQLRGEPGEENLLAFEHLPYVALSKTYNTNQQVPDSAGTATAMLTGTKTRAGMISVEPSVARGDAAGAVGHELTTLFERAEARGLATGVVTTTRVTHATPATAYAHSPERNWEVDALLPAAARAAGFPDIARQLLEFRYGDGLDVVLGGGRAFFLPARKGAKDDAPRGERLDGRDLLAEWRARGPQATVVTTRSELLAVDPAHTGPLLGLFAPSHMAYSNEPASGTQQPTLAEMTAAALAQLALAPRGFVLLVEGGRIDHGHHDGSAYHALHETIAFSDAVRTALERVDLSKTLVVVTADHSHQLTLGGYPTRGNPILGLVVENDEHGEPKSQPALDALGLPYTTLGYRDGPGYPGASNSQPEGAKHWPHEFEKIEGVRQGRPDLSHVDTTDPSYLQEATTPEHYESHGGEDVAIYAGGPGAQRFHGVQEQNYIYHAIVAALGWKDTNAEIASEPTR